VFKLFGLMALNIKEKMLIGKNNELIRIFIKRMEKEIKGKYFRNQSIFTTCFSINKKLRERKS
jgi:hypothetical protein